MTDRQRISFTKMHGTGNDFVVFDNRAYRLSDAALSACAAEWCPRRYGVGADGLLALDDPRTPAADYRMHYVNADGSRATMCGNGARCLFRFARQTGFERAELTFDTDAGPYRATSTDDERNLVRLFVPEATDVQSGVALDRAVPDAVNALHYAHAGTEHLVALVDDVSDVPVRDWGQRLRHDPSIAPTGANVNFAEVGEAGVVRLRTYEKGVEAETLSCGTGVLATAVIVEHLGGADGSGAIQVHTKGGKLQVGTTNDDEEAERYLEGPAVPVFRGTVQRPDADGR